MPNSWGIREDLSKNLTRSSHDQKYSNCDLSNSSAWFFRIQRQLSYCFLSSRKTACSNIICQKKKKNKGFIQGREIWWLLFDFPLNEGSSKCSSEKCRLSYAREQLGLMKFLGLCMKNLGAKVASCGLNGTSETWNTCYVAKATWKSGSNNRWTNTKILFLFLTQVRLITLTYDENHRMPGCWRESEMYFCNNSNSSVLCNTE